MSGLFKISFYLYPAYQNKTMGGKTEIYQRMQAARQAGRKALAVLIAVPDRDLGRRLARSLLEARLAASVQILGPIESHYWWREALHEAEEHLLLCKTTRASYPALEARIVAEHPYELPEIVALPLGPGLDPYLAWIRRYAGGESAS